MSCRQTVMRCPICLEKKQQVDMQTLNCKHIVCGQCLAMTAGSFCPALDCEGARSTDIFVDEMAGGADESSQQISFGTHTMNMLELEERQKCDARRGPHWCSNVARMSLKSCRHNFCYDCLAEKIQSAAAFDEAPNCPTVYCANRLSRAEVRQLGQRSPLVAPMCAKLESRVKDLSQAMVAGKDEIVVDCSIYGKDATRKRIIIPKACNVGDVLSAILQMQRLAKNRSTSSLGIFIRKEVQKGVVKYEPIRVKELGKKTVKDLEWEEKMIIVVDIENHLARQK